MESRYDRTEERTGYAKVARYYDAICTAKSVRTGSEVAFIGWALGEFAKGTVARVHDVSCGTGRQLVAIARQHPDWQLSGSDISPEMLDICREALVAAGHTAIELACHDLCELPWEDEFDGVVSVFSAVNHLLDHEQMAAALQSVNRALRSGGVFVFDHMNFLGLWDSFQRQIVQAGRCEQLGASWHSVIDHSCTPHKSLWRHTDNIHLVFDDGRTESLLFETTLRMWTTTEVEGLIRSSGFTGHRFFAGYDDRGRDADPKSPTRAVWVCAK